MRLPDWVKVKSFTGLHDTKRILRHHNVSTVCEEASCPNRAECFAKPTAAFMILGSVCTRNCGFCSVKTALPEPVDENEPERVALTAKEMGLRYVVVTSVTRDDLKDGGASQFARTVSEIKKHISDAKVEVLTPDFKGDEDALKAVINSVPDVYNHNIETVPRLYSYVRSKSDYNVSLQILSNAKHLSGKVITKSGLMLGLGEMHSEVLSVLKDLRNAGCDAVTIGQYLRPSMKNLPVKEYIRPEIFDSYKQSAQEMGFRYVASSPLARSSMNAEELFR